MASYKVPQDVEADDKLIGPFSFRQFIYLIIVVMAGALAWGLAQLFIAFAIIPLPIILFFGALALPLRKDQPMEIYMAAMVSYYLKPRNRKWDPEGVDTLIEISAPKTVEVRRTKDLSQNEAQERLSYLANIVDSGGWAIRGVGNQPMNSSLNTDVYLEAQSAEDILDTSTTIAQNFDQMMQQSTARMHEEAKARMMQASQVQQATVAPIVTTAPVTTPAQEYTAQAQMLAAPTPAVSPIDLDTIEFNPYPTIHQSVIQPLNDIAHQAENNTLPQAPQAPAPTPSVTSDDASQQDNVDETAKGTSDTQLTTDIINLANNPDISIETIAHEAKRIHKKAIEESEEVVISLR